MTEQTPRKKRRRRRPEGDDGLGRPGDRLRTAPDTKAPSVDAQGRDRPAFVLDFPSNPELDRLVAAFERGDYLLVRTEAERVAATARDPAVQRAALELRRRIDPDPLAKYLLAVAIGLLLFLVLWTYGAHPHP